jgi:hypothetical protein
MPHTSEETLGRRRFQLSRDQAVEAAIEKIRHAPDAEWHSFSGTECARLREILGEIWGSTERGKWEEYVFSALTRQDLRDLLDLGGSATPLCISCVVADRIDTVLSRTQNLRK